MAAFDKEDEAVLASSSFNSTDDQRVENNSARSAYRTLTDQEKASIDAIKYQGELLIDQINGVRNLAKGLFATIATDVPREDNDYERRLALTRLMDSVGAHVDETADGEAVQFETQSLQIVKVQEAVMWAVRGITA